MFSLVRQATPPRLAHSVACAIRYSSSQSEPDGWRDPGLEQRRAARLAREAASQQPRRNSGLEKRPTLRQAANDSPIHDPGIEQRRTARLAREAASQPPTHEGKRSPNQINGSNDGTGSTYPRSKTKSQGNGRPRKFSKRDHLHSSPPRGVMNPSETEDTQLAVAEAIMAISQREAENSAKDQVSRVSIGDSFDDSFEDPIDSPKPLIPIEPQITGPEPVARNMAALLNITPKSASGLPSFPSHRKLQQVNPTWIKEVYGGDYSQYQLETSSYINGVRGPGATYAQIILQHNRSVPLESQRELIGVIQRIGK